jgi:hypothetical protein
MFGVFDFASEPTDVDVDGSVAAEIILTPDLI